MALIALCMHTMPIIMFDGILHSANTLLSPIIRTSRLTRRLRPTHTRIARAWSAAWR